MILILVTREVFYPYLNSSIILWTPGKNKGDTRKLLFVFFNRIRKNLDSKESGREKNINMKRVKVFWTKHFLFFFQKEG